jgi:hypothetical protein
MEQCASCSYTHPQLTGMPFSISAIREKADGYSLVDNDQDCRLWSVQWGQTTDNYEA